MYVQADENSPSQVQRFMIVTRIVNQTASIFSVTIQLGLPCCTLIRFGTVWTAQGVNRALLYVIALCSLRAACVATAIIRNERQYSGYHTAVSRVADNLLPSTYLPRPSHFCPDQL